MSSEASLAQLTSSDITGSDAHAPKPQMPMRTLVFSSQKGGSGKTTLCGQLAVEADRNGLGPVALIDTDPQGSLSDWWNARADNTPLFVSVSVDQLSETLAELRMAGVKLVFIDTQPTVNSAIKGIVKNADMVVIPTRPSPHDLRAVGPTLDLVESCNKPMVFAVNCATRRAKITGDAAVALSQHGTVAPVTVHNRTDFATSMINGKTVMEANPDGLSAQEIRELWVYILGRLERMGYESPPDDIGYESSPDDTNTVAFPGGETAAELLRHRFGDGMPPQAEPDGETPNRDDSSSPQGIRRSAFGARESEGFGRRVMPASSGTMGD